MPSDLEEIEFVIFDTETTGLDPLSGDRIVEIAAIRFKGSQRLAAFASLVNPHRPISEGAFQVNRITADMLQGAPEIEEVLPEFLKFIQGSCLCSYNAAFDLEFLNHELKLLGSNPPADMVVVDILRMARRLLPGLERYALWHVAEKLGINIKQQHRAFSDVELTWEIFKRLKENLRAKGICDFQNLRVLFGMDPVFLEDIQNQKIAQIQEAMDLGVKLKIKYLAGSTAEITQREVIPKEIRREKRHSYLVGHCCLKDAERSFRIDGILHLEII